MKGVESTVLLLSLFLAELQARGYQCTENMLSNCANNPRLTVVKSQQRYKVTLYINERQCYNSFCIVDGHEHEKELMCNNICDSCMQLQPLGKNDCGQNRTNCEEQLDIHLNDFCARVTSTTERATTSTITVAEPCPTSTTTIYSIQLITMTGRATTSTITVAEPCPTSTTTIYSIQLITMTDNLVTASPTCSPWTVPCHCNKIEPTCTPNLSMANQTPPQSVMNSVPVTLLGVLLGLFVVLLVVVTTGWVCTCVAMKKQEAKNTPTLTSRVANLINDDKADEERFFKNPTYDILQTCTSTTQPHEKDPNLGPAVSLIDKNFPETAYDSVNLPFQLAAKNGQMYDVLNRGHANGSTPATDVGRPHNDENYSQLRLQEN